MPFTAPHIARMEAALKAGIGDSMQSQDVELYQGATVKIRLYVGTRRANERDLTGGAVMDTQLIATIDADSWDDAAGRVPQKGDVIWWDGKRHAVERASVAAPAGNRVFYQTRLVG